MIWPDDYHNQLIGGDCMEIIDTMPAACVDLMVTDPEKLASIMEQLEPGS
jgi:DNA modification methylase